MESWEEIFKGVIPVESYKVKAENGEMRGLVIELLGKEHTVIIDFGFVSAFRMLDEGLVMENMLSDDELAKYKPMNFANTIYKVENGEFRRFLKKINRYVFEYLEVTHYLIITMNYVIEVMAQWEPTITVTDYEE